MGREKIRDLVVELATELDYISLKDAIEIFEDEMAMRLVESFEDYVQECELRGEKEPIICSDCPVNDECDEIHNIESEIGLGFEDLVEDECECTCEQCSCEDSEEEELTEEEICELLMALYGYEEEQEEESFDYRKLNFNKAEEKEEEIKEETKISKEDIAVAISTVLDLLVLLL